MELVDERNTCDPAFAPHDLADQSRQDAQLYGHEFFQLERMPFRQQYSHTCARNIEQQDILWLSPVAESGLGKDRKAIMTASFHYPIGTC